MLSSVYQLNDDDSAVNTEKDGGNRLYWRANRRRMTAEQLRDSMLAVSGALDPKIGGPSEELTPAVTRRTIYGMVSRYKLDQFLQLFDFPAATISAEQRYSTSVPLQRLFFMNSDFMQQQGELLARRVSTEPDTRSRIVRAYRIVFGRAPTEAELAAGIAYMAKEPLRAYEERKAEAAKELASEKPKAGTNGAASADNGKDSDMGRPMRGDGMMGGVTADAAAKARVKLLPVTPFGRYMKVLLSSNEFLFVD
jgi:hypothetical protein